MRIGFTGTRRGMTQEQQETLRVILDNNFNTDFLDNNIFIHGGCVGADAEAAEIAKQCYHQLWCWPSELHERYGPINDILFPPLMPLIRNYYIVDMAHMMIACPKGTEEERRSGTWATIRYARTKPEKDLIIIWPSGSTERT